MREEMSAGREKAEIEQYKKEYNPDFFKEKLKEILKDKGMTQKELADRVGIQAAAFTKYFNGMNRPSYKNVKEMAKVLCVRVEALYSPQFYKQLDDSWRAKVEQDEKLMEQTRENSSLLIYLEDIGYSTGVAPDGWHCCVYSPKDKQHEKPLIVDNAFVEKIELVVKTAVFDWMYK